MNAIGGELRLVNVTKKYGSVTAVSDISFTVRREFLTLLGPSGSGKTTTLAMIAGFTALTSGQILLDGVPLTDKPPYRRGLGVVFQNYALFPHLSVFENIAFPLKVRKLARPNINKRVEEVLELVGLSGFSNRMPQQLSGGQQQRVAVARALVFDPSVLLMDEPLGALDKKLRERLQIEIRDIQRRLGVTVIYVTHDQEEALVMSDRIAVMNESRLEQIDTPMTLYQQPANRFVADFIGQSNFIDANILESAPGRHVVEISNGVKVKVSNSNERTFATGADAALILRPEEIFISSQKPTATNSIPMNVVGRVFVGDSTKYFLAADALRLTSRIPGGRGFFDIGDQVFAYWSEKEGRLLD